jgi:hypothetical protein
MAVTERTKALSKKLHGDWDAYTKEVMGDKPTGACPLSALKIEALASIAALAEFHCNLSRRAGDLGDGNIAHAWAVDEGFLQSAFTLLTMVDTESL